MDAGEAPRPVTVEYDRKTNAAYVRLAAEIDTGGVAWTYSCDLRQVPGMVNLDFDHEGRLVGIELLDATGLLRPEVLASALEQ